MIPAQRPTPVEYGHPTEDSYRERRRWTTDRVPACTSRSARRRASGGMGVLAAFQNLASYSAPSASVRPSEPTGELCMRVNSPATQRTTRPGKRSSTSTGLTPFAAEPIAPLPHHDHGGRVPLGILRVPLGTSECT